MTFRVLMPGRKLLLQSRSPLSNADSSTLLEPFTASQRYLNLNESPRAAVPHQWGFVWKHASVALVVSRVIGPVEVGVALLPVTCSAGVSDAKTDWGNMAPFQRNSCERGVVRGAVEGNRDGVAVGGGALHR